MEALASFAVACNVLQVIDASIRAISLCKQVYEQGASIDNQDLEQRLKLVAENAKILQDAQPDLLTAVTRTECQLRDVAGKCLATTNDLQVELTKLRLVTSDGPKNILKKQLKTLWRRKTIQQIEEKMEKHQNTLQAVILAHMSREQATFILDQQDSHDRLDDTLRTFIQRFADGCTSLSDLVRAEENQTRLAIVQNSKHVRDHVDDRLGTLKSDQLSELRRQRFLDSLWFSDMNTRRNDIEDIHIGTYEFVFNDDRRTYKSWSSLPKFLRGEEVLYWIQGKAGSGKSSLMKFIHQDKRTHQALSEWRRDKKIIKLSFFFWLAGDPLQRSSKGLWCSLLHQLLLRDSRLINRVQENEPELRNKHSIGDWSINELSETFLKATELQPFPVFILLDGLDEFDQKEGALEIVKHVKTLARLSDIKLLVSSRPEFELRHEFKSTFVTLPQMMLQDLTKADIAKYVEDYLQKATTKSQLGRISQEQVEELISVVVDRADGVFIWVRYVLKSLIYGAKRCSTWAELQQHLEKCPNEIHALYREMWGRLNPDEKIYREEAATYFHMAIHGKGTSPHRSSYQVKFSVFDYMLAINPTVQNQILGNEKRVPLFELAKLCDDTVGRLTARCAGLLEISNLSGLLTVEMDEFGVESKNQRENEALSRRTLQNYIRSQHVRIIHRSVHDFLTGTPEGRQILSFFQPTQAELNLECVHLNMAILLTLGWEDGYDWNSILWDMEELIGVPFIEHRTIPDDILVDATQTVVSSYARVLNLSNTSKRMGQWNFKLNKLKGYMEMVTSFGVLSVCMDMVGLAANIGITPFVRSFVQRVGQGRRLRKEYVNYLLLCACVEAGRSNSRPIDSKLVVWLLRQKADPNQRQYVGTQANRLLQAEEECTQFLTTPFLSYLMWLIKSFLWYDSERSLVALPSSLHQLIGAGANLQERAMIVLTPDELISLPDWIHLGKSRYSEMYIILELDVAELLANLARYVSPVCPSGRSYRTHNVTLKVHLFYREGRFWQPGKEQSDLIFSAYEREMKATGEPLALWETGLMKKGVDEIIPQCREVSREDVRKWLVEIGWIAPEGYVSPVDVDHPFEDE